MKTIARGLAVWLAAAALAPAETAVPAEAPPAGRSFSLGVHLAYWDLSQLDGLSLDGNLGAGVVGHIPLRKHLAVELLHQRLDSPQEGDGRGLEDCRSLGEGDHDASDPGGD